MCHRTKFSCPRFVHPWKSKVKKTFGNKRYIQCSPLLSPRTTIIIYNNKSAMNPSFTMLRMSGTGAYVRVSVCRFAALVSAECVPDVFCYWCRRLIETSLPILLRVSLFLWLLWWCWKWRSQGMLAVKYYFMLLKKRSDEWLY